MFIINSFAFGPGYDADAIAFFNATGIGDTPTMTAINNFVVGLKSASLWAKMLAVWPMVGGTGATHKYNLMDPQDTDAANRLTYGISVLHGSTGINSNVASSVNGAVDCHFIPSAEYSDNGFSTGCLNHTSPNINNASGGNFFGGQSSATSANPRFTRGVDATSFNMAVDGNARTVTTALNGVFLGCSNIIGTNVAQVYVNGAASGATISTSTHTRSTVSSYLLRLNNNGTIQGTCQFIMKFAFYSLTLNGTEWAALSTLVFALQTDLGR